jgi:hypothetical protein
MRLNSIPVGCGMDPSQPISVALTVRLYSALAFPVHSVKRAVRSSSWYLAAAGRRGSRDERRLVGCLRALGRIRYPRICTASASLWSKSASVVPHCSDVGFAEHSELADAHVGDLCKWQVDLGTRPSGQPWRTTAPHHQTNFPLISAAAGTTVAQNAIPRSDRCGMVVLPRRRIEDPS